MVIELTEAHLHYMNIGERFWGASLEGLTEQQAKALGDYPEKLHAAISRGLGLFLWGPNGTGKSYITAALCKHVWRMWRVTSYCVTAAELKEAWINDVPASVQSTETMTERAEQARFFVIDDLGKEHRAASGFAENKFGALLRHRARTRRTTVITSNLNPKEFVEIYGTSVGALAKECMWPVQLKSEDMRDKVAGRIRHFMED